MIRANNFFGNSNTLATIIFTAVNHFITSIAAIFFSITFLGMQNTSVSIIAGNFSYIALRRAGTIFLVLSLFTLKCAIALKHLRYTDLNVVVFGNTLDIWRVACYSILKNININLQFHSDIHHVSITNEHFTMSVLVYLCIFLYRKTVWPSRCMMVHFRIGIV